MKYLTFVIIALTARVYIVTSECWIPMVCDGIPNWTKVETTCRQDVLVAEMKNWMKKDLDGLTDQTTDSANQLKDLEKKFELLKSRQAANNPPKSARSSPCTFTYNSTLCYWVEVQDWWDEIHKYNTSYTDAVKICKNQGSEIGQIYNKEIYDEVMKILWQIIPKGWADKLWIGLMIDTKTGEPTYPSTDAYTFWDEVFPLIKDGRTNVGLWVVSDEPYDDHGMFTANPRESFGGVVCQVNTG